MRRMDKKSNKNRIIKSRLLVLIITLALIAVPIMVNAQGTQESQYTTVVVHSGDTLWAIASEYTDNNKDVRETIYNIKKANNMDGGMIVPGQELLVPIK
jgi:LysM repeat protein